MTTEVLYLTDPYLKELRTKILTASKDENGAQKLVFEQTILYPIGGGQSCDQGTIKLADGSKTKVYDVVIRDGEITNYVKSDYEFKAGEEITINLDWDRRYKNMLIHSAGHVVDFALQALNQVPEKLKPLKGSHGKGAHIIYEGIADTSLKDELQSKVNELIENKINFFWEFSDLENLSKKAKYLQPGLPTNKPLRALSLEGVGTVADGGTIVKNTSEIPGIKIEKIESNGNETVVYYSVEEKSENSQITKSSNLQNFASTQLVDTDPLFKYIKEVELKIINLTSEEELTSLWREYLGKEGKLKELLKGIKDIAPEERKDYGAKVNELSKKVDELINTAKSELQNQKGSEYLKKPQATLDFKKPKIGHLHPITKTANDLNTILGRIGYSVYDGPEIESYEYNFRRCNVPDDHPALDLQDSIYIQEPNILLRTQTSSIEARALELLKPPFKIVMPGRTYRNEKVNKTNHFTFHQYQMVCVQEKVSLTELIGTIDYLFKSYLGEDVVVRYRNKYYPEVEPGLGLDQQCFNCKGQVGGCPVCKHRRWIEMGGAGIIHPNIMRMAGLDTNKWQGFAFGLGLDRWAMSKNKITDIRTLLGGNLAYLPNVG